MRALPRLADKWGILAAVSLTLFLGSIDGSIVNVALPTLMDRLQTDLPTAQWVVLAYLLGLTVLMVSAGRLADLTGKKLIFTAGLVLFLAASMLCGLAPDIHWLIAFRFLQSIGAAMMLALGAAIVTETWPEEERGKAIGISSGVISMGIVIGPAIGGFLLQWFGWRWIFYVNLPVGAVALLLVLRYVPPLRSRSSHEPFDLPGAVALGVALVSLTTALTRGQSSGFADPSILALFGLGAAALLLFVMVEQRSPHPMVDLSLFRSRVFRLNLFIGWLAFVAISGIVLLLPFYLELVLGLTLQQVGMMMAAAPIMMGILQPFTGTLSDRIGTLPVSILGLAVMAGGYLAMSTLAVDGTALGFTLRLLPAATGMAIFHTPNNSAVMGATPPARLGVASGILSMTRTLGQVTGIALLGAFFNHRVAVYAGGDVSLRAAAPEAIVRALHDQFLVVAALVLLGLCVALWTWRAERIRGLRLPLLPAPLHSGSDSRDSMNNSGGAGPAPAPQEIPVPEMSGTLNK